MMQLPNMTSSESPDPPSAHPCIDCQRRKVKCDRASPCGNCLKYGRECKQPDVHREPRRQRRARENATIADLRERIRVFEKSLAELRRHIPAGDIPDNVKLHFGSDPGTSGSENSEVDSQLRDSMGRLFMGDGKSRYISGSSWANLANDVDDMRTLLEDHVAQEGVMDPETPYADIAPTFVEEPPAGAPGFQPSVAESQKLWAIYVANINPVYKIVHVPSMQKVMETLWTSPERVSGGMYSLVCALYFATISSLSEIECQTFLGYNRDVVLSRSRYSVKAALKRAKFLTSQVKSTLQALVVFLTCNRRHEEPRISWLNSGIALRLGQAIGLHRDGTVLKLAPFEIQERRRLWWLIRMLDAACAEDCGFMPSEVFDEDTKLPYNVNDADVSPGDSILPSPKPGFTENTFSLIRFTLCSRMPAIHHLLNKSSAHLTQAAKLLDDCRAHMEREYLRYCSSNVPIQRFSFVIANLIMEKLFLVIHYPILKESESTSAQAKQLQDKLFDGSCKIIEWAEELLTNLETRKWGWLIQTYMEWHAVSFLLRTLTKNPNHPEQERAWTACNTAFTRSHGVNPNKPIWQPVRLQLEKAKQAAFNANTRKNNAFTDLNQLVTVWNNQPQPQPPNPYPSPTNYFVNPNLPVNPHIMTGYEPDQGKDMQVFIGTAPNIPHDDPSWWLSDSPPAPDAATYDYGFTS